MVNDHELFVSLGLDKHEWVEYIKSGESSLASFLACIEESISESITEDVLCELSLCDNSTLTEVHNLAPFIYIEFGAHIPTALVCCDVCVSVTTVAYGLI